MKKSENVDKCHPILNMQKNIIYLKNILNDITNDIFDLKVGGLIKHFLKNFCPNSKTYLFFLNI